MKRVLLIGIFILGILINATFLLNMHLLSDIWTSWPVGMFMNKVWLIIKQAYGTDSIIGHVLYSGDIQSSIHRFIGILFFLWAIFMIIRSNNESHVCQRSNTDIGNRKSINRRKFTFLILLPFWIHSITGLLGSWFIVKIYNLIDSFSTIWFEIGIWIIWTTVSYFLMRARCADFNNNAKWIVWLIASKIVVLFIALLYWITLWHPSNRFGIHLEEWGLELYGGFIEILSAIISSIILYTIITLMFYPWIPKKTEEDTMEESANFHTSPIEKV